jgi:hypothetical protein
MDHHHQQLHFQSTTRSSTGWYYKMERDCFLNNPYYMIIIWRTMNNIEVEKEGREKKKRNKC